jgi:hypothetical protein
VLLECRHCIPQPRTRTDSCRPSGSPCAPETL